jgi:lipopolysaccharide/colanic/teichoic acid biosynthesis glycosyltransferase
MNSLARSESSRNSILASAIEQLAVADVDNSWVDHRVSVTLQSGLPLSWLGGKPIGDMALGDAQVSARSSQLAIKRLFDIVVSALAVMALLPLFTIVALCITLSSKGPVLFKQKREGLNGELFDAFKFRSMRIEACDPTGVEQTLMDDPRVTPIGRFIRKTSIDELPQLFNVLRGDMSLVGPRPHVPGMRAGGVAYRILVPYYDDRLVMRPGITGWAQANGFRGPTVNVASAVARVDHDVAYVQNFSLWLDIKIIAKTIIREFVTGSGH